VRHAALGNRSELRHQLGEAIWAARLEAAREREAITIDADRDLERGSVATVYLALTAA